MTSKFYNFAYKNYRNGNIDESTLDNYVTKGLITAEEKLSIIGDI